MSLRIIREIPELLDDIREIKSRSTAKRSFSATMSRLACGGMVEAAVAERRCTVDSGHDGDRDQGKHVDTPELFIITFIRIYYLVYLTYSHLNLVDKLFCPTPHRIIVG